MAKVKFFFTFSPGFPFEFMYNCMTSQSKGNIHNENLVMGKTSIYYIHTKTSSTNRVL